MARERPPPPLDPAVVCGLLSARGEQARAAGYEHAWERDHAVWRAVSDSLRDAAAGARPLVLTAEPPRWLARLVRQRLETLARQTSWGPAFSDIRTLERLGLVELPVDDDYVLAAVGGLGDGRTAPRAEALRADPELVDRVVWRMFEVEGGGEVSLSNVDKYSPGGSATWQGAFVELTEDGTLDRERVLTSALAALGRDFSAYRAGWYARLYDALRPTADELERHQPHLRALLRSDVAATVGFAVTRLKTLAGAGRLDTAAAVPALEPAVLAKAKGTALAALRLVAAAAEDDSTSRADVVSVATTALQHPHADVQRAAVTLLARLDAQHAVLAHAEQLEPSVQRAVGLLAPADREAPPVAAAAPRPSPAMPPRATADDVLDRTAALLEDAGDVLELELVLDGLAGLDDPTALRPLVKRATSIWSRGPREGVMAGWLRGQLARLVLLAAGQAPGPLPTGDHTVAFLAGRIDEVGRTLSGAQRPQQLLATPDDASGWLTAGTLVDRLLRASSVRHHDLVAGLLRLHPDGREAALGRLDAGADLPPEVLRVVRYALGGPAPAARRPRFGRTPELTDTSWWIAASRTRAPLEPDEWLAGRGVRGAGRSLPISSRVEFHEDPYTWRDHRGEHHAVAWRWTVVDPHAGPVRPEEPTAVGTHTEALMHRRGLEDFTGWLAWTYPHDAEHFLSRQVDAVLYAAAYTEVNHDAVLVLDALGRHPGRLGPLARTCLAAGLTASRADQRARAVDAVHGLHAQGRLGARDLGEGLRHVAKPATLPRWASSLRDLAAIDAPASRLVVEALVAALPAMDASARGLHALLELLHEELLRAGVPTPARLLPWLEQCTGSSRAARAAQALRSGT